MRDPHVVRLHFIISSGPSVSYENSESLTFDNRLGHFEAGDGRLTVEPADHFPDERSALNVVEPFLRSWEISADLAGNPETIRFRFTRADVVDRDPPPTGTPIIITAVASSISLSGAVAIAVLKRKYPKPVENFVATSDVARAHARWLAYRAGKEPLQAMGYFVLTIVEASLGSRKEAARALNIDRGILARVGELTSTKGDPSTARKAPLSIGQYQDLTGSEHAWLETTLRKLIQALGEHAAGTRLPRLTWADLPPL